MITEPHFNGPDYRPKSDFSRLSKQHQRIKALMKDGKWRTLNEISEVTNDPEASISAQLRHLRKKRFGSYVLEKRNRGSKERGLFEYRLLPPGSSSPHQVVERRNKLREALEAIWIHEDTTEKQRALIRKVFRR